MRWFNIKVVTLMLLSISFFCSCKPNSNSLEELANAYDEEKKVNTVIADKSTKENPQNFISKAPKNEHTNTVKSTDTSETVNKNVVNKETPDNTNKVENMVNSPKNESRFVDGKIKDINSIEKLDKASVFSFAIMSDNNGDGPKTKPEFKNMVDWIKQADDKFVIGLGDHVKKGYDSEFLGFVKRNKFWFDNFYPNVADGENDFYGNGQGDWGSGRKIFEINDFTKKKNVKFRENGCEYYAQIKVGEYTVHLIQLHYPDTPSDYNIAFPKDSRKYLEDTLNSIDKGEKDIVIACAHSRFGFFYHQLNESERKAVYEKCDLVLSATTHVFMRLTVKEYGDKGPLFINTGSTTYPRGFCHPGYTQVHVLEDPFSLVVQYYDTRKDKREFQSSYYAWIKEIGGEIIETSFRKKGD